MFRPIRTSKINEKLYVIRTGISNFYIYDIGNNLIAFDGGISGLLAKRELKKLGIKSENISHIFLTHSDFDHVGLLKLTKNAKVYLSEKEVPLINHEKARRLIIYNSRIKNYEVLTDGKEVKIDDIVIKCYSTPGHTIGSACYSINDEILITGDTILLSNDNIKPFSFIQNMSHKKNKEIVSTLLRDNFFDRYSMILTGHTGILNKNKQ